MEILAKVKETEERVAILDFEVDSNHVFGKVAFCANVNGEIRLFKPEQLEIIDMKVLHLLEKEKEYE